MVQNIDAAVFQRMVIHAHAAINAQKQAINDLNVFPVPDGDTGTNMTLSIGAASKEMKKNHYDTVGQAAQGTASALLRGARGNSGVILSLLFRGFAKAVKEKQTMDGRDLAIALDFGVAAAYKAVMKPAEGTILTVSRLAAARAAGCAREADSVEAVLEAAIEEGQTALENTINQNPVLKKAGVVDAGGKGFLVILQGMLDELRGVPMPDSGEENAPAEKADFVAMAAEEIYSNPEAYLAGVDPDNPPLDAYDFSCNYDAGVLGSFSYHLRAPRGVLTNIVEDNQGAVLSADLDAGALTPEQRRELYLASFLKTALGGIRNFDNGDGTYTGIGATYFCLASSGIDILADTLTMDMVEYDARGSEWYIEAANLGPGEVYWTDPLQDASGRGASLICAMPVYVDGELLDEDYINDYTYREEGTVFPLTVPEGEVFLMGDNRNHSNDSRDSSLGTVDTRLLIGKAVFLVFPGRDYLTEQREFGRIGVLQ